MFAASEELAAINNANVEAALSVTTTAFAGAERLATLNLNTARAMREETIVTVKALVGAEDQQELASLQSSWVQQTAEKASAYTRGAYEIAAQTQEEFSNHIDAHFTELTQNVAAALEQAVQSAPAVFRDAVVALKSAFDAANLAGDDLRKGAKRVVKAARANVAAVAEDTDHATAEAAPHKAKKAA